ncbi:hypothetical protein JCM8547_005298 [Rhodosporidiobolus lusitaniae]
MSIPPPKRTLAECDAILTAPGSPFEFVEQTIKGRRIRTYKNLPASARDLWAASSVHGNKEYIIYEHERLTYAQAHEKVARLAALFHERGVKKGGRVAIAMRNLPEWVFSWWALHTLGAVGVAVNAWLTPDAFLHCLALTEPTVVLVDVERARVLKGKTQGLREKGGRAFFVVRAGREEGVMEEWERLEDALEGCKGTEVSKVEILPEDPATIFFTSGTTSYPKGVLSTQRQYMSNRFNTVIGGARALLRRGESLPTPEEAAKAPQKSVLLTVPLFHVIGNQSFLQLLTAIGGLVCLVHKFSPSSAAALIRKEGITTAGGVPNMVMQILDELDRSQEGWKGLRLEGVSYGGGPASERLPGMIRERLGRKEGGGGTAGPSQGYGLTETNSVTTGLVAEDYYARPTSCGLPPPVIEVKIIDPSAPQPASSAPSLPRGREHVGEICIKGPNVVEGYYRDEEASRKAFDAEGWFRSGDLGYLDEEGFLYLVDRAKDIIIRSGENISSVLVENAILQHPTVKEVAVVPVKSEEHGEEVAAVVLLHPRSHPSHLPSTSPSPSLPPPTASGLAALVASQLPKHCTPSLVFLNPPEYAGEEGVTKNATGKVLKEEVKKVVGREWERRGGGRRERAKL